MYASEMGRKRALECQSTIEVLCLSITTIIHLTEKRGTNKSFNSEPLCLKSCLNVKLGK